MPYFNAYNNKIANEVNLIDQKYLNHLKSNDQYFHSFAPLDLSGTSYFSGDGNKPPMSGFWISKRFRL